MSNKLLIMVLWGHMCESPYTNINTVIVCGEGVWYLCNTRYWQCDNVAVFVVEMQDACMFGCNGSGWW